MIRHNNAKLDALLSSAWRRLLEAQVRLVLLLWLWLLLLWLVWLLLLCVVVVAIMHTQLLSVSAPAPLSWWVGQKSPVKWYAACSGHHQW
jgi:hypothetical protein